MSTSLAKRSHLMAHWYMPRPFHRQINAMKDFVDVKVSYRKLSDTALIVCDEAQLEDICATQAIGELEEEVETYQLDFDTHVEIRPLITQCRTQHVVVAIQIVGADSRQATDYGEIAIPHRFRGILEKVIANAHQEYDDCVSVTATHEEFFHVPFLDVVLDEPLVAPQLVHLSHVKAVSAAVDDFGAAHHRLMLRSIVLPERRPTHDDVRLLWSGLAQEIDHAQGLGPVSSISRAIKSLRCQATIPADIRLATYRTLEDLLQTRHWQVAAATLREATKALDDVTVAK
jgi:hypothetical protein